MKKLILFLPLITSIVMIGWVEFKHYQEKQLINLVQSQEKKQESLVLPGKIKAKTKVDLKFPTSGKLVWVGVKVGDRVKKGQAIAALDQRELKKRLQKALNRYLSERWNFEQTQDDYQDLKDRHLLTETIKRILDQAQFKLNNAVLEVEINQLALEYATLISPIEGIVVRIDQPVAGVNITPAKAVFTIVDPKSLYFEAEADEEEVVQLQEGFRGKIVLDAYPDQEIDSQIELIEFTPLSEKGTPTYAVHCLLPDKTGLNLRLGMNGEITIQKRRSISPPTRNELAL